MTQHQRGFWAATYCGLIMVVPLVLSLIATFIFYGWEGVVVPFQFQASRKLNWESTYDAIGYVFGFGTPLTARQMPLVAQALMLLTVLNWYKAR